MDYRSLISKLKGLLRSFKDVLFSAPESLSILSRLDKLEKSDVQNGQTIRQNGPIIRALERTIQDLQESDVQQARTIRDSQESDAQKGWTIRGLQDRERTTMWAVAGVCLSILSQIDPLLTMLLYRIGLRLTPSAFESCWTMVMITSPNYAATLDDLEFKIPSKDSLHHTISL
jgi:hypothetical protein